MPSPKRPSGDAAHETDFANKAPRLDTGSLLDDYASSACKKANASSRTGQACDRCKIRKIRCDARPGGCSPCAQNQTECKTTDRITGRATSRGHTEHLENENTALRLYMIELQAQLKDNNIEPRPPPNVEAGFSDNTPSTTHPPQNNTHPPITPHEAPGGTQGSLLPEFRSGCIGDNYLGVSSEHNYLSPIEGTSLALFGTKINLDEFMQPQTHPDVQAVSYPAFLSHAFSKSTPASPAPALPEYETCKIFADWYFRSVCSFTPVVHRPDFMRLLAKMYQEGYQPTPAETVMVHMMLAMMNFQFAARNVDGGESSRKASLQHYHYSLGFVSTLIESHKLEDIQALTLICSQLRSQQRPGAAWMFTNMILGVAIESGLHRSAKAWQNSEYTPHAIEMRKRVFWSLYLFHVSLSGKLGRPIPLRLEDFDIEIPEPASDILPSETNVPKWKKCSFRAAIQGYKLVRIVVQVYSSIYTVRSSSGPYEVHVRQIEKELEAFQAQIPPELSCGPQTREEDRVSALYLRMAVAECQLLSHHPSLYRSTSSSTWSNNLDICLEASANMLSCGTQLRQLKALDTTWYYATNFLAAIFTTLFVYTQRHDQITSEDFQKLKKDMAAWMDVLLDVGHMLGSGSSLQERIGSIVDQGLETISKHLTAKTAAAAVATSEGASGQESTPQPKQDQAWDNQAYYNGYGNGNANGAMPQNGVAPVMQQGHYPTDNTPHMEQGQNQYAAASRFPYQDPQSGNMPAYSSANMGAFDASAYSQEDTKPNMERSIEAQLNALAPQHTHQPGPPSHQPDMHQAQGYMNSFHSPAQPQNGFHTPNMEHGGFQQQLGGPAAWRDFAANMATNVGGVGFMAPNQQTMFAHSDANVDPAVAAQAHMGGMQMPTAEGQQSWPLIHYNTGPDGQGQ